jgi:hypothetical protein
MLDFSSQYMAIVFGILSVCPGLIVMILFLCGSWFDNKDSSLEKTTIGNYGLVSTSNGSSQLGVMLAASPSISAAVGGVELTTYSLKKREEQTHHASCSLEPP